MTPLIGARRRNALLGLAVLIFGVAGKNPLLGVAGFVVMLGAATALVLNASSGALRFFYQPAELAKAPHDRAFRLGGLVEAGSVRREADGRTCSKQEPTSGPSRHCSGIEA